MCPLAPRKVCAKVNYSTSKTELNAAGLPIKKEEVRDVKEVLIHDLRTVEKRPDLETNGFAYVTNRQVQGLQDLLDRYGFESCREKLALDSVELVKQM